MNPLDLLIKELKKDKYKGKAIADHGCGEGRLADEVTESTVFSYDIGKIKPHVIQCDMAQLPAENESMDVSVFCLSLMGTNYIEFLFESNRILKPKGLLFVAEVESRVTELFSKQLEDCGFKLKKM